MYSSICRCMDTTLPTLLASRHLNFDFSLLAKNSDVQNNSCTASTYSIYILGYQVVIEGQSMRYGDSLLGVLQVL